jgi:hypothetical protein
MDGKSVGADPLPRCAGSRPVVFHIHAPDLIGVAVERVAAGVTLVRVRGKSICSPPRCCELNWITKLI